MTRKDIIISVALMALWGFNFCAIKLGAEQTNPILLTALRFSFAVFPAILFVKRPDVHWGYLVSYGFCFGVGIWGCMVWSMQIGVSPGMAGILLDMSLVFSLALGYFLLREHIGRNRLLGAVMALIGLGAALALEDGSVPTHAVPLTLVAAFSWSVLSVIVKKSGTQQVFAFGVWGMAFAPIALATLAYIFHGAEVFYALPAQLNGEVWFSILFQAYPTTLFGYWVWNRLIIKYPISTLAPFTLLNPIFGLIGGMIFFQEALPLTKVLAFAFVLGGLALSQKPDRATVKAQPI